MPRAGDPLEEGTLYGPMHSKVGMDGYMKTVEEAKSLGGKIEFGGQQMEGMGGIRTMCAFIVGLI